VGRKAKNSTAPCGRRTENRWKRNALPLAGEITQPSQQRFTRVTGAELDLALDFFA
jgi:hypothetical protein